MSYLAWPSKTQDRSYQIKSAKNYKLLQCLIFDVLEKKPMESPEGPLPDFKPEDFILEINIPEFSKSALIKYNDICKGLRFLEKQKYLNIQELKDEFARIELTFDDNYINQKDEGGAIND